MNFFKLAFLAFILFLMNCTSVSTQVYEAGVSYELAKLRKQNTSNINYYLFLSIPETKEKKISGIVEIEFKLEQIDKDLIIDFQTDSSHVNSVTTNTKSKKYLFKNEHIVISKNSLQVGQNTVRIEFIAGDQSLNRYDDYLYSLFVPDKASIAFPCFDQPDLKATYNLELEIPEKWTAISNGSVQSEVLNDKKKKIIFSQTAMISTYHFAFAVGLFQKLSKTKKGRTLNLFYREFSDEQLKVNSDSIFDIHFAAIEWMENYTEVPYPYEKLDFVIIPSFQFSGMEHVGAIFYRDSRMFLSSSASTEDVLKRALIISHEVSHMWFGDLVTMKWFDDVWLKEVYAELLASKMVNPMFPEINHDLNFVSSNYPRAYQTDRSIGTNSIVQKLDNLKFAGTLYGDIIYYKAPIVMAKLERLIGEKALQDGLKEYLTSYRFANASWSDLIQILNKYTKVDLNEWSDIWVKQEGMPVISSQIEYDENNKINSFKILQKDGLNRGRLWKQNFEVLIGKDGEFKKFPIFLDSAEIKLEGAIGLEKPDFVLLNGEGYGYGYFVLDFASQEYLLEHVSEIKNDFVRTISYITLYQALMNYRLDPEQFIRLMSCNLKNEEERQNVQLMLDYLKKTWWYFLDQEKRLKLTENVEDCLFDVIKDEENKEIKSAVFHNLLAIFISKNAQDKLYKVWKEQKGIEGLEISGTDYSTIALELSLRDYPNANRILLEQLDRIDNDERRAKMLFIMPAVSTDKKFRDAFFESLKKPENRQHEIWVRSGLYYLNHPLRAEYSVKYLQTSLEMLEEIQQTGDIFFPKNWLVYTVGRYNSAEAATIVTKFLDEHPGYNENLRAKILQLSDLLFRAEKIMDRRERFGNQNPLNGASD